MFNEFYPEGFRPSRYLNVVRVTITRGSSTPFAPKRGTVHDFDTWEQAAEAAKSLVEQGIGVNVEPIRVREDRREVA